MKLAAQSAILGTTGLALLFGIAAHSQGCDVRVASQVASEVGKPSPLITKEEGCAPPKKLEYKPWQPIEQICASEEVTVPSAATKPD